METFSGGLGFWGPYLNLVLSSTGLSFNNSIRLHVTYIFGGGEMKP